MVGIAPVKVLIPAIGGLAQLVEHLLCKQGVIGSSPLSSTIDISPHHRLIDNVKKRSIL